MKVATNVTRETQVGEDFQNTAKATNRVHIFIAVSL